MGGNFGTDKTLYEIMVGEKDYDNAMGILTALKVDFTKYKCQFNSSRVTFPMVYDIIKVTKVQERRTGRAYYGRHTES